MKIIIAVFMLVFSSSTVFAAGKIKCNILGTTFTLSSDEGRVLPLSQTESVSVQLTGNYMLEISKLRNATAKEKQAALADGASIESASKVEISNTTIRFEGKLAEVRVSTGASSIVCGQ